MRRSLRVGVRRPEVRDSAALEDAERRLAVLLEDPGDRAPVLVLDPRVEIDEVGAVPVGQALAHDALAAAGQPDEHDVHRPDLVVAARAGFVRPGQSMGGLSGVRPGRRAGSRPAGDGGFG